MRPQWVTVVALGVLRKRAEETHAEELSKLADEIAAADELLTAAASMRTAFEQTRGELGEPLTAADIAEQLRAAREGTQLPQLGISPSKADIITAAIRAGEARQAEQRG